MVPSNHYTVIFFDGVCNLCNGLVRFIIRRDPAGQFRFASLQSHYARQQLLKAGRDPDALYSMIVLDSDQLLERSDAVLAIAKHLGGAWRALTIFKVLPRGFRDALYNFIAANRYRWFGRRDQCMIPTPDLKARFLG